MRNLLFLSLVFLMMGVAFDAAPQSVLVTDQNYGDDRLEIIDDIKRHINNDSIYEAFKDYDYIFYYIGQRDHMWSMIVDTDPEFTILNGSTRTGEFKLRKLAKNEPLIMWGMESLPTQGAKMQPVYHDPPELPSDFHLIVKNDKGIFEQTETV